MAEKQPLKLGVTGAETFASSDTLPRTTLPAVAIISPSQITSDQDNYNPTGFSTADIVRLDFDTGGRSITGLTAWSDGRQKVLINIGTNYGVLACEHPDSSAANRFAGTCDSILAPGASATVIVDGTTSRIRIVATTFRQSDLGSIYRGAHLNLVTPSSTAADNAHAALSVTGTGAAASFKASATGLLAGLSLATGTTSTGAAAESLLKEGEAIKWGDGHFMAFGTLYIPTLSTSGQRYSADISFASLIGGPTALPGRSSVGVRYSDNLNTGKWLLYSYDGSSVQGTTDSGVTVAANTLYSFVIIIDKGLTEARFFINGSYAGRVASNLPSTVHSGGTRAVILKSVGTTSTEIVVNNLGYSIVI